MTREETAEAIKVMQAWRDGETVELCDDQLPEWQTMILNSPKWQFGNGVRYRIKPEPTLVPWSKPEDVPMNCWVCHKDSDDFGRLFVVAVHHDGLEVLCDKESSRFRW